MHDRNAETNHLRWVLRALPVFIATLMVLFPEGAAFANDGLLGEYAEDAESEGRAFYEFVRWPAAYGSLGILILLLIFARDKTALLGVTVGVFIGAAIGGEIIDWGMNIMN